MDRINTGTKAVDLFGAGKHGFRNGDLSIGVYPTDLDEDWFNGAQEELMSIIEGAGVVPDIAVHTKVKQAIKRLFGGNITTVNAANSPLVLTADNAGLVIMDATAGNISATLPAANVLATTPASFRFVRYDATANTATVNRAGADTFIGGATFFTLAGLGNYRCINANAVDTWHTSSESSPGLGSKNKFINTDMLINQDGTASGATVAAGVYVIDGFKAGAAGWTGTYATVGGVRVFTTTAGSLEQVVEPELVDSAQVTTSWTGTAQGRLLAGVYAASPFTTAGLALGASYSIEWGLGTLTKVQTENGDVATAYERLPPALSLARCTWFCYFGGAGAGLDVCVPTALSAPLSNAFRITTTHPTPMRSVPSCTITAQSQTDRAAGPLGINSGTNRYHLVLQGDVAAGSGVAQWTGVKFKADSRL